MSRLTKNTDFQIRLTMRIGTPLGTEDNVLTTSFGGKQISIRARDGKEISKSSCIVFEARTFPSEEEANDFGKRLRNAVHLVALCSRVGAHEGRDTMPKSPQGVKPELNDSLEILSDDENTMSPYAEVSVSVVTMPEVFLDGFKELCDNAPALEQDILLAIRVLNTALFNTEHIAKIVLAFSAVEALATKTSWTDKQHEMISGIIKHLKGNCQITEERTQVIEAVKRMYSDSLRQSVKRLLSENNLNHLQEEWDQLYGKRSNLFHGRKQLSNQRLKRLAIDAIGLCGGIILTIAHRNGVSLPATAYSNFGISH